MTITALLSWYDEDPAWLERCVTSLAQIPVDHLIALDGPYELFDGPPRSPDTQTDSILLAAQCATTIYRGGFEGNEIEKRNHLFHLAERHTQDGDWYMVIDADEYVLEAPASLRDDLASTPFDVAAVDLIEPGHALGTMHFPTFPMFFRAIRGLRAVGEHFNYRTPDGRNLWGDAKRQNLEPRHMTGAKVMHESELRDPARRVRAKTYYTARDDAGVENLAPKRFAIGA